MDSTLMSENFIVYALDQDIQRKVFYEINGDYYNTITLEKETRAFRRIFEKNVRFVKVEFLWEFSLHRRKRLADCGT